MVIDTGKLKTIYGIYKESLLEQKKKTKERKKVRTRNNIWNKMIIIVGKV